MLKSQPTHAHGANYAFAVWQLNKKLATIQDKSDNNTSKVSQQYRKSFTASSKANKALETFELQVSKDGMVIYHSSSYQEICARLPHTS